MEKRSVVIVGMGPRGLVVIERIRAYAKQTNHARLDLHIVETGVPGVGVHYLDLPEYFLVNLAAGQTSIFGDEYCLNSGPTLPGLPFDAWANQQGYSFDENGDFHRGPGRPVSETDFYPRKFLGEYLNWAYEFMIADMPSGISVTLHRDTAIDAKLTLEGGFEVYLDQQENPIKCEYLFLTTGHPTNLPNAREKSISSAVERARQINPKITYFHNPYPITQKLRTDAPVVAVEGFGLTAIDIIAELTQGRGGRYEPIDGSNLRYLRSGREPTILVYSLDGLPLKSRAKVAVMKGNFPLLELAKKIADERGKIDFDRDAVPLMKNEMRYRHYEALFNHANQVVPPILAHLRSQAPDRADWSIVENMFPEENRFNWNRFFKPLHGIRFADGEAFHSWLVNELTNDIGGVQVTPYQVGERAARSALMEMFNPIRAFVQGGRLTEQSQKIFDEVYSPSISRWMFGPPTIRSAHLKALIECGILVAKFGPGAQVDVDESRGCFVIRSTCFENNFVAEADFLIGARVPRSAPELDSAPFTQNLLKRGLVTPFVNGSRKPGGIDVTEDCRVKDIQGQAYPNFWAMGTVTEGVFFATHHVVVPKTNSVLIRQAGVAVGRIFSEIKANKDRSAA